MRFSDSSETVLSAAHCFHGKTMEDKIPPSKYRVAIGITNAVKAGITGKGLFDIEKYTWHPNYKNIVDEDGDIIEAAYDYAIVKLKKSVTFDSKINPACLPDPNERFEGVEAFVSGWGIKNLTTDPNPAGILQLVRRRVSFISSIL